MTNLIVNRNVEIEIDIDPFDHGIEIMSEWDNIEQLKFFLGMLEGLDRMGPLAYNQIYAITDEANLHGEADKLARFAEILHEYFKVWDND